MQMLGVYVKTGVGVILIQLLKRLHDVGLKIELNEVQLMSRHHIIQGSSTNLSKIGAFYLKESF